jgi:type II secretory pathway predicted ATPase ExeA
MQFSSSHTTSDLGRLVVSARHALLAEIVNSLMLGTQFVALTGASGVGKTGMAAAIHEELARRAVRVQRVNSGGGSGIHLSTIIAQLLGKPESDVSADDIEWLFGAMTERELPDERQAVIIDDAELLHSDVFRYLRLLSSVAMERMPQVVFVGDPSFWDTADRPARTGFQDLITVRWELEPLNADETRAVAGQLVSAPSRADRPVFDEGALEAVVQRSDGLIGRVVALLAEGEAIASERQQSEVTTAVIDAAARRHDWWTVRRPDEADHAPQPLPDHRETVTKQASERSYAAPELEAAVVSIVSPPASVAAVLHRARRVRNIALLACAAAVIGTIGAATYWSEPLGADRMWAQARTALGFREPGGRGSPDAGVIVRLPPAQLSAEVLPGATVSVVASVLPVTISTEASEIIAPPELASPQTGDGAPALEDALSAANVGASNTSQIVGAVGRAPRQNSARVAAVQKRRPPYVYERLHVDGREPHVDVSRSNQGTWLFAPNSNGN